MPEPTDEEMGKVSLNKKFVCDDHMHKLMLGIHNHSQITFRLYLILLYIFSLLGYLGIFFGLLAANFKDQEFIEEFYYRPFHLLAFWGVFGFTVIEAFVLILSKLASKLQISLLSFNIVATLMTAILFTFYPEFYEAVAHYLEYSIQILISAVNLFFVFNLMRKKDNTNPFYKYRYIEIFVVFLVILLSIFQLLFYSDAIPVGIGGERTAHFCEFVNEIMNGLFALWYACVVYLEIQAELTKCSRLLQHNH